MRSMRAGAGLLAALIAVAAAVAVAAPATGSRPGLEGRWRLAEQHFESGGSDLLGGAGPMWLVFSREGPRMTCRIRISDPQEVTLDWPALLTAGTPRTVRIEKRVIDAEGGRVTASYTVARAPSDDETLLIVEDYALSDDASSLIGTVTISLRQDGEDRGGYRLRRRFEREP